VNPRITKLREWLQDYYGLLFRGLSGVFQRPFYHRDLVDQMEYMGADALPIVVALSAFIGMALSLQINSAFADIGLQMGAGTATGISIISEIGPVLTGVIFAGRNGVGMASELGSMVLGNQVDTLRVFGVDPIKKLVTPRLTASLIMLPCLTVIGDAVALLGAAYLTIYIYNSSGTLFWDSIRQTLEPRYIAAGLLKPLAFGIIVASMGCYAGLHTSGGARGLRNATTWTFVFAVTLIIIADFLITRLTIFSR
jgi:phospholipid/cholesterol/gamma-HCH transport system permease protein